MNPRKPPVMAPARVSVAMPPSSPPPTARGRGTTAAACPSPLDEAVRRTIHAVRVADLSARLAVPAKALYRYATDRENPSNQHRHLPVGLVAPLVQATGDPAILMELAALCGFVLVPLATAPLTRAAGLIAQIAAVTRQFGELQICCGDALADPRLTPEERRTIAGELYELVTIAAGLRQALLTQGGPAADARA